jgi:hypothetical protein
MKSCWIFFCCWHPPKKEPIQPLRLSPIPLGPSLAKAEDYQSANSKQSTFFRAHTTYRSSMIVEITPKIYPSIKPIVSQQLANPIVSQQLDNPTKVRRLSL